jgi:hypothetical protein
MPEKPTDPQEPAPRLSESERRKQAVDSGREYTVPSEPMETDGMETKPSPKLDPAGPHRDEGVTEGAPQNLESNRMRGEDAKTGSSKATEGTGHTTDSHTEAMRGTSA